MSEELHVDERQRFIEEYMFVVKAWLTAGLMTDSVHDKRRILVRARDIIQYKTNHLLTRCEEIGFKL